MSIVGVAMRTHTQDSLQSSSISEAGLECATMRAVGRRLIPFLFVLYIVCFLDRVNVGFAALEMNRDLGLGPAVYGFGAGIFFIGYSLCEVPSNLILARVGARRWIARIMITWGWHDVRSRPSQPLCAEVPAGRRRRWFFPWDDLLSQPLVSSQRARSRHRTIHDCHSSIGDNWCANLRGSAWPQRPAGNRRVAVALP